MSESPAQVERLLSFSLPDGGLPYYRGNASSAEPTFLAALALSASGAAAERAKPLLHWAQTLQNTDGSVSINLREPRSGALADGPGGHRFPPLRTPGESETGPGFSADLEIREGRQRPSAQAGQHPDRLALGSGHVRLGGAYGLVAYRPPSLRPDRASPGRRRPEVAPGPPDSLGGLELRQPGP